MFNINNEMKQTLINRHALKIIRAEFNPGNCENTYTGRYHVCTFQVHFRIDVVVHALYSWWQQNLNAYLQLKTGWLPRCSTCPGPEV